MMRSIKERRDQLLQQTIIDYIDGFGKGQIKGLFTKESPVYGYIFDLYENILNVNSELKSLSIEEKQAIQKRIMDIFNGNIVYALNGDTKVGENIHSYKNALTLRGWNKGLINYFEKDSSEYNMIYKNFVNADKDTKTQIMKDFNKLPEYYNMNANKVYAVAVQLVEGNYDFQPIISGEITQKDLEIFTAAQAMIEDSFIEGEVDDIDFNELFRSK